MLDLLEGVLCTPLCSLCTVLWASSTCSLGTLLSGESVHALILFLAGLLGFYCCLLRVLCLSEMFTSLLDMWFTNIFSSL